MIVFYRAFPRKRTRTCAIKCKSRIHVRFITRNMINEFRRDVNVRGLKHIRSLKYSFVKIWRGVKPARLLKLKKKKKKQTNRKRILLAIIWDKRNLFDEMQLRENSLRIGIFHCEVNKLRDKLIERLIKMRQLYLLIWSWPNWFFLNKYFSLFLRRCIA